MRIFVASPKDVANYREAVLRVAERSNRENDAKLGTPGYLEVVDWTAHLADLQSLPEEAILEHVEIGEHDLFIGMAWLAFDPDTDSPHGSTERNFSLALSHWRQKRPASGLFCRCMRLPDRLTDINGKAFDRVSQFFSRFALDGDNPAQYYEFDTATDLEEYLVEHLNGRLRKVVGLGTDTLPAVESSAAAAQAAADTPAAATADVDDGASEFERKMQEGKAYEVSFLSLEIAREDAVVEAERDNPQAVQILFRAFRELARSTANKYGGEIFRWQDGGGLLIFWSSRSFDHAIMTGLKVLHNLPVFNLDPDQNPLGVNIKTRSAAHDAVIVFQRPARSIESNDIDFVVELQRQHTDAAELSITRRLLERVDKRLRPHFKFKDRFENEPVYSCRLPSNQKGPDPKSLDDFIKRISQQDDAARKVLGTPPADLDIAALEGLSTATDEIYSILNKFCTSYSNLDTSWDKGVFRHLANAASALMGKEAELWKTLRKTYISGTFSASKASKLEAIVKTAARRRARPVVILDKLAQRCHSLAGDRVEAPVDTAAGDELTKRLDAFIKADTLDVETALTELLLHHKEQMLDALVRGDAADPRLAKLFDKLWKTADLVLLDDLYSIRGRQRADEPKAFEVLIKPDAKDGRFRVIRTLLAKAEEPSEEEIRELLQGIGYTPSDEDIQTALRCLVLGHHKAGIRRRAAFRLSTDSMWQVISHPNMPLISLQAIGERVKRTEGEDIQKIFFDCVRARVESAIESANSHQELAAIANLLVLLIDLPFLVEGGYFERFDDLLRRLLEQSQKQNYEVEYFERLRKTLEEAYKNNPEKGPSKPPAGIQKLPLTIQRRLASESRYVYWFVTHPDPRIATETLRHVGLMNIERVLRLREVNSAVMNNLLRKPELFTRNQAMVAALNHPKCSQEFATKHLMTLSRSRQGMAALQKVASNPSANPAVRAAAKRSLAGNKGRMARR